MKNRDEFFRLPIAGLLEDGLPNLKRDDPTGFRDEYGYYWSVIVVDGIVKRKRIA